MSGNINLSREPDSAEANKQLVIEFINAWVRLDAKELANYFCEDGVYFNIPSKPVKGRQKIEKFIADFSADWKETQWDILSIAAQGDTVLVERNDNTKIGNNSLTLPCNGVFIIQNGKIKEWRDYFDMLTYIRGAGIVNLIKFSLRQMKK